MKRILLAAAFLAAPAFAEEGAHKFELVGLEIQHPWTNATDEDHANLFMELHNESGAEVQILGARLENGAKGHVIGFRMKDGQMGFDELPAFPLAAGQEIDLSPDGVAIHLEGLGKHLHKGDHFHVTLLTSLGEVELEVAVEDDHAHQHSHAGHNH